MGLCQMHTNFKTGDTPIFPPRNRRFIQPLGPQLQPYIKDVFWPHSRSLVAEYVSHFKYFERTLGVVAWSNGTVNGEGFAIKTYEDLAKFVRCMKESKLCRKVEIAERLHKEFATSTQGQILRSLDLTARLWLTLHVRSDDFPFGPGLSDTTETQWTGAMSLNGMIGESFTSSNSPPSRQEMRIDAEFTVVKLSKLCRLETHWTANLKDHLRYDQTKATLHTFPHKICLVSHLESSNIFPEGVLAETIRTLDLLFPFGHESTREYLDKSGQTFYRTSSRDLSRPIDFGEFHHWRKRLMDLHDVFEQAPRSVLQIWFDRRNPIQWWTFWLAAVIAVLTVVFGVISSYTGYRQAFLAEKAHRLQVWQACSKDDPPIELCMK